MFKDINKIRKYVELTDAKAQRKHFLKSLGMKVEEVREHVRHLSSYRAAIAKADLVVKITPKPKRTKEKKPLYGRKRTLDILNKLPKLPERYNDNEK